MKSLARFLMVVLCVAPFGVAHAVVSSTAGNNLTAYNGESGATNNNRWNTMMNVRSGGDETIATADFGNCNAVIMRCAQPKCANGGCTDLAVTAAIVTGCVQSSEPCKQYGEDLVEYIAAQLVASSTAKANAAANAAQTAAANAAAAQNAQQMQQMQAQMQQMQSQMAAQNAQTVAQLQSALEEQKQLTANAIAEVNAARVESVSQPVAQSESNGLSEAQITAAQNGVSADALAREQVTGQIMSSIENAQQQLKTLRTSMLNTFEYAGCDSKGNNCTGPKRVKIFKQKAQSFFEPYENVLDELYDALVVAQSVGVDITDIYMMLNGSCNVWGQYLCSTGAKSTQHLVCDDVDVEYVADKNGNMVAKEKSGAKCHYVSSQELATYDDNSCPNDTTSQRWGVVRGGHDCVRGMVVPPEDDISCTLNKTIVDDPDNPVQRDWLWAESDDTGANIRVGCASAALESSKLFHNRKKQASIDVEVLQRIIEQDAPSVYGAGRLGGRDTSPDPDGIKFCAVSQESLADLQKITSLKKLPDKVCVSDTELNRQVETKTPVTNTVTNKKVELKADMSEMDKSMTETNQRTCIKLGGKWDWETNECDCTGTGDNFALCMKLKGTPSSDNLKVSLDTSLSTQQPKFNLLNFGKK